MNVIDKNAVAQFTPDVEAPRFQYCPRCRTGKKEKGWGGVGWVGVGWGDIRWGGVRWGRVAWRGRG